MKTPKTLQQIRIAYATRYGPRDRERITDSGYPLFDDVNDKLLTSLRITFDKNYRVISNGNLTDERNNSDGKTKTWVYEMAHPHANYLIMLAIGDYAYRDYTSKNGIVSRQYYYPDLEDRVEPTYAYSAEMMDWISEETGLNFPWPTYANVPVQEFLYGAMENTPLRSSQMPCSRMQAGRTTAAMWQ